MQVIAFNTLILEDANLRGRTPCAKCEETEEFASSALTAAEALLLASGSGSSGIADSFSPADANPALPLIRLIGQGRSQSSAESTAFR